jgi:hypothetical protein
LTGLTEQERAAMVMRIYAEAIRNRKGNARAAEALKRLDPEMYEQLPDRLKRRVEGLERRREYRRRAPSPGRWASALAAAELLYAERHADDEEGNP